MKEFSYIQMCLGIDIEDSYAQTLWEIKPLDSIKLFPNNINVKVKIIGNEYHGSFAPDDEIEIDIISHEYAWEIIEGQDKFMVNLRTAVKKFKENKKNLETDNYGNILYGTGEELL